MNMLREAIRQILTSDRSNRQISVAVDLSHTTIANYKKRITERNLEWNAIEQMDDDQLSKVIKMRRQPSSEKRTADWGQIHKDMQSKHMTLQLLWEDYCLIDPETAYSYSTFADKYRKFCRKLDLSMRQKHRAGEMIYVDFAGTTVSYTRIKDGKVIDAQIFVGVMGCSNYTFAYAVDSQSLPDWVEAHNRMFLYLGGVPEIIVPDNLKSSMTRAGRNAVINRTYLEICRYYGIVVIPTRVRKPKDKAKAEVGVQIVSRWILAILRNRTFFSLEEINRAIAELLWQLNERPFKKLPGCRRSRFEELDKPMLRPHPGKVFEYAEWISSQKVGLDYHVRVNGHYYSVPHELVGGYVEARITKNIVEILSKGRRVASHPRSDAVGEHTTLPAHQPPGHRHYAQQTPEKMLNWAQSIGHSSVSVVRHQFDNRPHALLGLKACSSLQKLAKEYGHMQFEAACRRAESIGSLSVKSIRSILQRRLTSVDSEETPMQLSLPLHKNVRGAEYYSSKGDSIC